MIFKEIEYKNSNTKYDWEEIPEEELWEDGELDTQAVVFKMYSNVCRLGNWKLIRRKDV